MRKQPGIERDPVTPVSNPAKVLSVLSVCPLEEDDLALRALICHSTWMLFQARDLVSALALLQQHEIAVVLCERDLQPGTWIDVLEHIKALPNAPSLIVASRLADEHLWAEALNLGAWDVLAKPFDGTEVLRSVKAGWQRWHDRAALNAIAVAG